MKFLIMMLMTTSLMAQSMMPFLVTDSQSMGENDYFQYQIDSGSWAVGQKVEDETEGTYFMNVDLSLLTLTDGDHTAAVRACSMFGACSEATAPLNFTKTLPNLPANLRIVLQ